MDLYYNGVADFDWGNPLNWWEDSSYTIPAASPTGSENVFIDASVTTASGSPQCVNLNVGTAGIVAIYIVVTGDAIVASGAVIGGGGLTIQGALTLGGTLGNAVTCDTCTIASGGLNQGTITASSAATIASGGTNDGTLTSTAVTLSGTNGVAGVINGPTTINGLNLGAITGAVIIASGGENQGGVTSGGALTVQNGGVNSGSLAATTVALDGTNTGTIIAGVTIGSTGNNSGTISGNATMSGSARSAGTVTGTLTAPATDNGDGTYGYAPGHLGSFGTLKLTGIAAGGGGTSDVFGMAV